MILRHHLNKFDLSFQNNYHKIYVIGPTELKLWPFKDALFNAGPIYVIVMVCVTSTGLYAYTNVAY